ncbi:hypothetical protein ACO0QE_001943 [Hanseniaspora vineae]
MVVVQSQGEESTTPKTNPMSSKLILSRPFLTPLEIQNCQRKTISDRKLYNAKKVQIFRYLQEVIIHFKFPRKTLEVTMYLYQRYYLFHPFEAGEIFDVAIAALYLGCKQVETMKKMSEIIPFCNGLKQHLMSSKINYDLEVYKKELCKYEFEILNSLAFDSRIFDLNLSIDVLLLKFCKHCELSERDSYMAWIVGLEVLKLEVLLSFPCHVIAMCCLHLTKELLELQQDDATNSVLNTDKYNALLESLKLEKCNRLQCLGSIINFYVKMFEECELSKIFSNVCTLDNFKALQQKFSNAFPSRVEEHNVANTDRSQTTNDDELLETRYVVNRRYYDSEEQLIQTKKQKL